MFAVGQGPGGASEHMGAAPAAAGELAACQQPGRLHTGEAAHTQVGEGTHTLIAPSGQSPY